MSLRSKLGPMVGGLAAVSLLLAAPAQAREMAKFKLLSVSGASNASQDVVYEPSDFGSCSFNQTERVTFHSTRPMTVYAFTSKSHGRARVEWWDEPEFVGNLTQVGVPGEVTISRSATYNETNYVDPDTGETYRGCYNELDPENCNVERTLPATIYIGGTSDSEETTYAIWEADQRAINQIDDACPVFLPRPGDDPRVFSRSELFKRKPKRLADSDRVEDRVSDEPGGQSISGSSAEELSAELKRKKLPRK